MENNCFPRTTDNAEIQINPDPVKLFVSYSHKDEALREELDAHISPLIREGLAMVWHDRQIGAGTTWDTEISNKLGQAEVILLLVSPDFFSSSYCFGKEMAVALDRHNASEAIVIPIVIRPVDWTRSKLASIQALPRDAIPVTINDNRDEAWLSVATGIRNACESAKKLRQTIRPRLTSTTFQLVLGDLVEDIERTLSRDDMRGVSGIPTGFMDLDVLTDGLQPGSITVIASAPMMDRDGFLARIASHITTDIRLPLVIVCTNLDKKYLASRMLASISRINVGRMRRGTLTDDEWDRMTVGLRKVHEASLEMLSAPNASIEEVLPLIDSISTKYGALPVIIIDSIAHFAEDKTTVLRRLREYAGKTKRSVVAGVGLETDPYERIDKRPQIQDLGRWAAVTEDIDCLMLIYSDQAYYPETTDTGIFEVIIARSRIGPLATIRLAYLPEYQSFENLAINPHT